ncbi:MAG: AAA family ATPase [Planctomycetota bacterium]|nr:AAA family ATPase [Planctomycetota bacterium]
MDAQGMQTILNATPAQIRMLEQKLRSGYRFPFLMQLGDDFAPAATPAFLRRGASKFELLVETPLRYRGTIAKLQQFAEHGRHGEARLESLFKFIRRNFGTEPAVRAAGEVDVNDRTEIQPVSSVRRPMLNAGQITDLNEARRQLGRRKATTTRVLLDRATLLRGLQQRIHGQDAVLDILAERVCVDLAKSERRQPLSFFLFGPSGVGKTETALVLADVLSSKEIGVPHRLVRHNMNEYQERHSAYRLLGAPPSYVGYGDTPRLFQELHVSPRLVVVFDEIEKAHPDILQTLMALIDTGELACSAGGEATVADFRQCILIFTSNLGGSATKRLAERGLDMASMAFQIAARDLLVSQRVPPEIAGRIRSLLLFRELDVAELLAIVADKIQACGRAFGLTVRRVSPVLLADLAAQAKSTQFGVRIAEQLIEQEVAPAFVQYLRSEQNGENVEVTASDGATIVIPA